MDEGIKSNDKKIKKVERKINAVYSEAQKDLEAKTKIFLEKMYTKKAIKDAELKAGKITKAEHDAWFKGQMFQLQQWGAKQQEVLNVIDNANKEAARIVNLGSMESFAGGANWQAYYIEKNMEASVGFSLYNRDAVARLMVDNPDVLPKWKIDEPKEYVWNKQKAQNALTQSIIQGESLEEASKRLATALCNSNKNLAMTHAQTAMCGAQNAGRNQTLMRAKTLGINAVKEWVATLDGRTRDSHRHMDGEKQKVGDMWHPMKFSNGCRFPGDPDGPAHEVFNCRCALVGDVVNFPSEYKRYDNIDGKPIKNMTYEQWYKAKGMQDKGTPKMTKATQKKLDKAQGELKDAQDKLSALEQEIKDKEADKVFSGIWYNQDVTYADWEDKKDSIQSKMDYYDIQIIEAKADFYEMFPDIEEADEVWGMHEDYMKNPNGTKLKEMNTALKDMGYDSKEIDAISDEYWKAASKASKFQNYKEELKEFSEHGEEYYNLLKKKEETQKAVNEAKKMVDELKPKPKVASAFGADAYSEERKKNAIRTSDKRKVDNVLRPVTGDTWLNSEKKEHMAAYDYTAGSGKFNRPLRGYDDSWGSFKGIGNVSLNNEYAEERIKDLTEMIKKSKLPEDMWFTRGVDMSGMAGFLQVDKKILRDASEEELQQLLIGKVVTDSAFMSCGSAFSTGFGDNIVTYCPKGTQALYVEPFSAFSGDHYTHLNWDGKSKQSSLGNEFETIVQRNTDYRITKVRKEWGDVKVEVEVVDQRPDDWSPWE